MSALAKAIEFDPSDKKMALEDSDFESLKNTKTFLKLTS
ncbi:hypothetical protein GMMP15_1810010 [Candidatus Magnetomoraceae bacterium gMMP-15]